MRALRSGGEKRAPTGRRTRNARRRTQVPQSGGESSESTASFPRSVDRSDRTGPETRRGGLHERAEIVAWRAPFLGLLSAALSRSLMLERAGVRRIILGQDYRRGSAPIFFFTGREDRTMIIRVREFESTCRKMRPTDAFVPMIPNHSGILETALGDHQSWSCCVVERDGERKVRDEFPSSLLPRWTA